ncbi:MAG: hypothetical protein DRP45_00250 [Candidatus Zixiibacteriota bacterium]|nr:MAG: hypothetical protein DRP45_00250 [candidate division Zixibacteria bacterium]
MIILAVVALGFSGAGAAARLFVEESAVDTALELPEHQCMLLPTPGSDEPADGMDTEGRPWTEQPARLLSMAVHPGSDDNHRLLRHEFRAQVKLSSPETTSLLRGLPTTPNMVASELGRQFTLVGAKPSGTS